MFSLSACSKKGDESFFDQQLKTRKKTFERLCKEFDAQKFTCRYKDILNQTVILDTVILGIKKDPDGFSIRTKVNTDCNKKYFAELRCSKEIVEKFKKTKTNYAFIAANILNAIDYNLIAESDTLDGTKSQFNLGNAVLLRGECLAVVEVPPLINVY